MNKYETTFVIDSLQKSDDVENFVSKVQNFIKNNGGEIGEVEDWGKKRLAYEINRKQYGNYYQIHFAGPSNLPDLLEREYRLEEAILRFLTIKSHSKAISARETAREEARKKAEASAAPAQPASEEDTPEIKEKIEPEEDKPGVKEEQEPVAENAADVEKTEEAKPAEE